MQRGSAQRGVAVFLSRHTQAAQRFSFSFCFLVFFMRPAFFLFWV
jgi:hypothetical protein